MNISGGRTGGAALCCGICQVVILYPGQQHILKVICSVYKFRFDLVLDSLPSELFNWVADGEHKRASAVGEKNSTLDLVFICRSNLNQMC